MSKTRYYVVWEGHKKGFYTSWEECQKYITGFKGARYKAFNDRSSAEKAFKEGAVVDSNKFHQKTKPIQESISVDAACSGNPGDMEYRGVYTKTGKELFKQGPFTQGTNNIGEFLAIVHALALLKQKNSSLLIYSDSVTAIKWIKDKKTKTKLEKVPENEKIFELISRAEKWLNENKYSNKILKWDTNSWGEIPADFGRK